MFKLIISTFLLMTVAYGDSVGLGQGVCNGNLGGNVSFVPMTAPFFYQGEAPGPVRIPDDVINSSDPRLTTAFEKQCVYYYRAVCTILPAVKIISPKIKTIADVFNIGLHRAFMEFAQKIPGYSSYYFEYTMDDSATPYIFKNLTCTPWKKSGSFEKEWELNGLPHANNVFPIPNELVPETINTYHRIQPQFEKKIFKDFRDFTNDLSKLVLPLGISIVVGVIIAAALAATGPSLGASLLAAFASILILVWPYLDTQQKQKYGQYYAQTDEYKFFDQQGSPSFKMTRPYDVYVDVKNQGWVVTLDGKHTAEGEITHLGDQIILKTDNDSAVVRVVKRGGGSSLSTIEALSKETSSSAP